jgi:sulfide:quinone oxidoreductase
MSAYPHRVLIAGGGIAAAELMIALRSLAEERVEIELLAPGSDFVYRPLAVAEPFGLGRALRFDLDSMAAEHGARRRSGVLAGVDDDRSVAITGGGAELAFDSLAIAVGAVPHATLPGALAMTGPGAFAEYRDLLAQLGVQRAERLVFVVPVGAAWALPAYELALLTSAWLASHGRNPVALALVTSESEPLGVFGRRASQSVRALLDERGIELYTDTYAKAFDDGRLLVHPGNPVAADRVVALPRLEGPRIAGLPCDADGFIPVDRHGRVSGTESVWAAGDATTFAVKQGGLATQQADVVAAAIAARAGADVATTEFDPVLRGVLLTGATPVFMRSELRPGKGDTSEVESEPLWWPPGKVAGMHLSHYLARLAAADPPREPFGLRVETDDLEPYLVPGAGS